MKEVSVECGDWYRRIDEGCFWAVGTGRIIAKQGTKPRTLNSLDEFRKACPEFRGRSWCLHFTNYDEACDWMAHKYIGWHINPSLYRCFEQRRVFRFHCHVEEPEIPEWLDAEFIPEHRTIVFYGLRNEQASVEAEHTQSEVDVY